MYELAIKTKTETETIAIYNDDYEKLAKVGALFVDAGYAIAVEKVDEE